ncbi:MAG TPA: nitroreductase family deazaflavin-dependent oxidoreductase [Thermomicrobiales bacterium]|jgi:deazaflavin-dependent oxidoreductase (nitroreductase family)|nr:nitroreductase family deazaflavin-dependent oxidoreductase [Thermomicrobiales bacterium]
MQAIRRRLMTFFISRFSRWHARRYEDSGGTKATTMGGAPIVLLTSIGARSGKPRLTPLVRVEHNGEYAVVASLGGAPRNPAWYYNVKANPRITLRDRDVTRDYLAREVHGDEKATWWERALAVYPAYADYQTRTDRQIPVFVLTPVVEADR